jgi:hypothetical protein
MKQFNNIEEMQPYFNEKENTYEFIENGEVLDIEINFDLTTDKNIFAGDINACDIKAYDINSYDINAGNINAGNINAYNINASDIKAFDIDARNINAWDIKANTIKANTILFDVVCFAHYNIICKYIKGTHENSKYFSLYGEVIIKEEKK